MGQPDLDFIEGLSREGVEDDCLDPLSVLVNSLRLFFGSLFGRDSSDILNDSFSR